MLRDTDPMAVAYRRGGDLTLRNIEQIAEIHRMSLITGGLSRLGPGVLRPLYRVLRDHRDGILIAAFSEQRVVGFVAGTTNLRAVRRSLVMGHFFSVGLSLLPKMLSWNMARRVYENLRYSGHRDGVSPALREVDTELLSIAVSEDWQGKGVAPELYRRLAEALSNRGEKRFGIVVGDCLPRAMRFYEKMGAKNVGETTVHKGEKSFLYVQELEPESE